MCSRILAVTTRLFQAKSLVHDFEALGVVMKWSMRVRLREWFSQAERQRDAQIGERLEGAGLNPGRVDNPVVLDATRQPQLTGRRSSTVRRSRLRT
jgi:hypothetical protein